MSLGQSACSDLPLVDSAPIMASVFARFASVTEMEELD